MAINVQIYSNVNTSSRSVSFDFVGDVLAADTETGWSPANASSVEYYFKITSGGTQDNNVAFPAKVSRSLSELVLNGTKQRANNTSSAYTDIRSMIVDYTYDYINGHAADLYSSGCTAQRPMKF